MKTSVKSVRIAALLLALLMILPMAANAASFSDTNGHWSSDYVEYMVDKKILNGYNDGTLKPDNVVTRAEFIKMLDETFGLTAANKSISYSDVTSSDWFYPYIQKAATQGYLLEYGRTMNPNGELTREEAAALLVRYLNLPATQMASSSSFSDYYSISSEYRNYVLQAVAAGLLKGYTDGTFGPKRSLTRAEALTILYRAAGCIYDATASGVDSRAAQTNAVITKGGVTVRSAPLKGTVIVTEGATNGTVTLSSVQVADELIVRGTARLILSDTSIKKLTVNTGISTPVSITLEDGAQVDEIMLVSPAAITTKTGTTVKTLKVDTKANGSSFAGTGALNKALINSSNFSSSVIPTTYEISQGLTATFAGATYQGTEADNSGFKANPTVKESSGYDYLLYKAAVSGTICYYYTNTSAAPTAATFAASYNSSSVHGTLSASASSANTESSGRLQATSTAMAYTYVVVAMQNGTGYMKPVVILRGGADARTGFSTAPAISSVSYMGQDCDCLTGTPTVAGKLCFFYTNTRYTSLTSEQFETAYNSTTASQNYNVKGELNVASGVAMNEKINYLKNVSAYNYVVVMLVDSNGSKYTPVILSRTGSSSTVSAADAGFTAAPVISMSTATLGAASTESVSFTPAVSGTLRYYFTNNSKAPTASEFSTSYASAVYKDMITNVAAGQVYSNITPNYFGTTNASTYPYVVFMLTDSTNNKDYAPYIVKRPGTANTASSTGFTVAPTVTIGTNYDTITFTAAVNGTLRMYYANTTATPTAAQFTNNFATIITNNTVPYNQGNVTAGQAMSFQMSLGSNAYNYVVFMLIDSTTGTQYQPVVVARGGGTSIAASGFTATPVVTANASNGYDVISSISVGQAGMVYYYYTNSPTLPNASLYDSYWNSAMYKSSFSVIAGANVSQMGAASATATQYGYNYVAFKFVPSTISLTTSTTPVIVPRNGTGSGTGTGTGTSTSTNGFTVKPTLNTSSSTEDRIELTAAVDGNIKYLYTDNDIKTTDEFMKEFFNTNSSYSGAFDVKSGTATSYGVVHHDQLTSMDYVFILLTSKSGQMYTPVKISFSRTSTTNN